jgi:hypothetical protein
MQAKQVRIVSGGLARTTKVYDVATGEDITSLLRVHRIVLDVYDEPAQAVLSCHAPAIDCVCEIRIETERTLVYDPDDIDSLDKAVALLSERRTELVSR